ncbi:hypothetical protein HYDPIDRAFT_27444 [Hydnomerulius pinastri MD-312]|nr:hypothetical protein HYDPIDRAFT_27444 [Hydnomerulius pinastri MD-312]
MLCGWGPTCTAADKSQAATSILESGISDGDRTVWDDQQHSKESHILSPVCTNFALEHEHHNDKDVHGDLERWQSDLRSSTIANENLLTHLSSPITLDLPTLSGFDRDTPLAVTQHEGQSRLLASEEKSPKHWHTTLPRVVGVSPSYLHFMSAMSLAQSRPAKVLQADFSYDDWLGLQALFANALKLFNEGEPEDEGRGAIALVRGVIHQCHRSLVSNQNAGLIDDEVSGGVVRGLSPGSLDEAVSNNTALECIIALSPRTRVVTENKKLPERTQYLTALHAILGTSIFFFGRLIGKNPSLALPGEPATSLPYWLSALDVFETGYNLPGRTSGAYSLGEDWLLATSGSRALLAVIGLLLAGERSQHSAMNLFMSNCKWPANSPLGTIAAQRPPATHRMALSLMSPNELMLVAADQFLRGILHMPHNHTAYFPHFSRANELLTIATEVLEVVEQFPLASERQHWASWAQSILNLIKPEMATEAQLELCQLARNRCRSLVGSHKALSTPVADLMSHQKGSPAVHLEL